MITIIDYQAGNLRSVTNALDRLGESYKITDDPVIVARAEKVIFPGVGAAEPAMKILREKGLDKVLRKLKVPVLGICLGMQLLFEESAEGDVSCLGVIPGKVKLLKNPKVPQIGWNAVKWANSDLTKNIPNESYFYFVNSYVAPLGEETSGISFYGEMFSSVVQKENFYGVQFHPEKSGKVGLKLLANFLSL
ncbi:imidazole glycerol phosphate synthase subunit HisH [Candidatus Peregrinibacteria bacterium]|jgi:imidazole glycerol-phosphate synthase subunit HisH|nr:imidazole glycerol phosphate synthase subunit HisH [Candidatus Peregrinibacteria bacterium]MBT7483367.1 imidazole glycerol phosphate synthase subunit HisH [Candidatus Peregrinibacteria bacterium]MBT7703182.1 imidazole glycerol phosphate synthase subunit HisH [Candidatus Peregrinibacteria bacterium]